MDLGEHFIKQVVPVPQYPDTITLEHEAAGSYVDGYVDDAPKVLLGRLVAAHDSSTLYPTALIFISVAMRARSMLPPAQCATASLRLT